MHHDVASQDAVESIIEAKSRAQSHVRLARKLDDDTSTTETSEPQAHVALRNWMLHQWRLSAETKPLSGHATLACRMSFVN